METQIISTLFGIKIRLAKHLQLSSLKTSQKWDCIDDEGNIFGTIFIEEDFQKLSITYKSHNLDYSDNHILGQTIVDFETSVNKSVSTISSLAELFMEIQRNIILGSRPNTITTL